MQVKEFLNYCARRNLSPLTVRNYRQHLKEYVVFLAGTKDIDETTPADLLEFICEQSEHVSAKSVNIKISSIRNYFDFCVRFRGMQTNPAFRVQ